MNNLLFRNPIRTIWCNHSQHIDAGLVMIHIFVAGIFCTNAVYGMLLSYAE